MKVTLDTPGSQNPNLPADPLQSAAAVPGRRDFAAILNDTLKSADNVSTGGERDQSAAQQPPASSRSAPADQADSETRSDARPAQPREFERDKATEEQAQTIQSGTVSAAFSIPQRVTPATDPSAVSAASILHPLDLAHMVAAVRTQLLPNGSREITIDLH